MTEIKIDSRTPELESGVVYNSFDKALAELTANGFEVISLPQNAELRIQEGKNSFVSKNGNYIREPAINIPKEGIYLVRNSPLLQIELAKEAVKSHRSGSQYSIAETLAKEYKGKASDSPEAEVFPLTDLEAIPTNKFDTDKRALWLFQAQSDAYGKFLYDAGIKEMPLWFNDKDYINSQEKPFINQCWLLGLGCRSLLGGYNRYLDYSGSVRGVRQISGEASAQNFSKEKSELYTLNQIREILNKKGFSDMEEIIIKGLRELFPQE